MEIPTCCRCNERPRLERTKKPGTYQSYCAICKSQYHREYYEKNREHLKERGRYHYRKDPDRMRDYSLRRLYGISLEEYYDLCETQGNRCFICQRTPQEADKRHGRLHVDHDHATGAIRGLLCAPCNRALGLLSEDTQSMRRMIAYMERSHVGSGC